ncbi:MAG: helix-turn-helix domain-containing protein [Glaciihabitans sp.]
MNETGNSNALGRFLTLADVAEVLNISTGAAYSLVRSGELPAIKLGRHGQWRIERDVLESYIEAKYEEARRIKAWREAEFDRVVEPVFGDGGDATGRAGVTSAAEERPLHGLPPHRDPPRGPGDRGA